MSRSLSRQEQQSWDSVMGWGSQVPSFIHYITAALDLSPRSTQCLPFPPVSVLRASERAVDKSEGIHANQVIGKDRRAPKTGVY